jgi:hypothetical protein
MMRGPSSHPARPVQLTAPARQVRMPPVTAVGAVLPAGGRPINKFTAPPSISSPPAFCATYHIYSLQHYACTCHRPVHHPAAPATHFGPLPPSLLAEPCASGFTGLACSQCAAGYGTPSCAQCGSNQASPQVDGTCAACPADTQASADHTACGEWRRQGRIQGPSGGAVAPEPGRGPSLIAPAGGGILPMGAAWSAKHRPMSRQRHSPTIYTARFLVLTCVSCLPTPPSLPPAEGCSADRSGLACADCADGHGNATGSCQRCDPNWVAAAGSGSTCRQCADGTRANSVQSQCGECSAAAAPSLLCGCRSAAVLLIVAKLAWPHLQHVPPPQVPLCVAS